MHQSFVARLGLVTPLILRAPTTLDAILLGELALHLGDEAAKAALPLSSTEGIYHASQPFLDATSLRVPFQKVNKRGQEADVGHLDRIGGTGRGDFIGLSANKYRNTFEAPYSARAVRAVYFAGVGDIEEIEAILGDVLSIGVRRAEGMGMISEVVVEAVDADPATWGLMGADGEPMRPVPIALWRRMGGVADPSIQALRPKPFYWDAKNNPAVACAVAATDDYTWLLGAAMTGTADGDAA